MLSFENAPPLSVPARFFVSAPGYGVLAGLLVLIEGDALLLSRWSPAVLALTHLLTVGLLMQVMIGALFQFLPVAADAGLRRPRLIAGFAHPLLNAGAVSLAAGFYFAHPLLLQLAGISLVLAVGVFVVFALHALLRKPHTSPSIPALKLALVGLLITVCFGLTLLAIYAFGAPGRADVLTAQHAAWGLIGWSATLIVGVAYVVVPMFQLTPGYVKRVSGPLVPWLFSLLLAWSAVQAIGGRLGIALIGSALALTLGVFAVVTLSLQAKSRRAESDTTFLYWRVGMLATLLASAVWAAQPWLEFIGDGGAAADALPVLVFALGALAIVGVLVSVVSGMLYKILPFLCWLHLQQFGMARGIFKTPHMGTFLPEGRMRRQFFCHLAALTLLLAGIALPQLLALAGAAMIVSFALLGFNLASALRMLVVQKRRLIAAVPVAMAS